MATSREQVIMALATDLKVWPNHLAQEKPHFDGWHWNKNAVGQPVSFCDNNRLSISKLQWEEEIKRLSSPPTLPAIKWKEGDETTSGKIAYVSSKHHNVMIRGTHSMKEWDGRTLERKLTKDRFIAQELAVYAGDTSLTDAFEKIIEDAEINWEDE